MVKSFNFKLDRLKPLSKMCYDEGIHDFQSLCQFVKLLPYGRNSNRQNYNLIFSENKGTCSTKHAFLKQVAIENNCDDIKLCLGIYRMHGNNTSGIETVLEKYSLDHIPEAHTYLKYHQTRFDFTRSARSNTSFENDLLLEEFIQPEQIGEYKIKKHLDFIKNGLLRVIFPTQLRRYGLLEKLVLKIYKNKRTR